MTRVVFFSFDYDDVMKVNQVRRHGQSVSEQRSGFRDKLQFVQQAKAGNVAIEAWIRRQMCGCSVTCVLIGRDTYRSKWVNFEIEESIERGLGLVGIYIDRLNDGRPTTGPPILSDPTNPLSRHYIPREPGLIRQRKVRRKASEKYCTYRWRGDLPMGTLGNWVEEAARLAGRGQRGTLGAPRQATELISSA